MAEDTAGKWIIGILIYFVVLFVILTFVNSMVSTYSITDTSVTMSGGSAGISLGNLGSCTEPRSIAKWKNSCKSLADIGTIYDQSSCESFEGCSWVNDTNWLGVDNGQEVCEGYINGTYYNNGVEWTEAIVSALGWEDSACELSDLNDDQALCEAFGCTWAGSGSTAELTNIKGIKGIWGVIGDIITANVQFGSSSQNLNNMLNFIFIVIPLLLLVIAGIIMLPFT